MARQFMKGLFKNLKADKIVWRSILLTFILLLINMVYTAIVYNFLPPFIPLFNQMPWGEQRLGLKIEVFLPFLVILSVFFINIILSSLFYEKMPLISRILSVTTLLVAIIVLIFIIRETQLIL